MVGVVGNVVEKAGHCHSSVSTMGHVENVGELEDCFSRVKAIGQAVSFFDHEDGP